MNAEFRPLNATQLLIDELEIAPENPRSDETVDALAVAHLADSIEAIGVLTPLIAYGKDDKWFVTAGGRRLRAIRLLDEEGRWDANNKIPVTVMEYEAAIDAGDAEQLTHQIMSDLDTIKVFARPEYAKYTDQQLGALVGRSTKYVTQRRAILGLPQEAIDALYATEITVSQAAGLTYWVDDPDGFAEALGDCKSNRHYDGDDLRRDFERRCSAWSKSLPATLVTQDEYREAGGKLQGDLFAEDQFILSPEVLDRLARAKAQTIVEERFPNAVAVVHVDKLPDNYRTHPGVSQMTAEEDAEWDEIGYDFYTWRSAEDYQEQFEAIEDPDEQAQQKQLYARWQELREKAKPVYPDNLASLLIVAYELRTWGDDPIRVIEHIIPDTTLEREALIDRGYMERPAPTDAVEPDAPAEPEAPQISAALEQRIKRIKAHCVRQDYMKRPNDVFEEFLVHIAVPSYFESHFSYRPEPTEHLGTGDPAPIFGSAWQKAEELDARDEDALRALKPAEQRTVLAMRILNCLRSTHLPMQVTPALLREYVALDADFFKSYKIAGMTKMLAHITGEEPDSFANQKATGLADTLERLFSENKDWLPLGF